MADELKVRPRLAPPLPRGYQAPQTPNRNTADPLLDSRGNARPTAPASATAPYARRDVGNDFNGKDQRDMRLVGWRERYSIVLLSGTTLDIANFSYFIVRAIGSGTFVINLPTPPLLYDNAGDPIPEAWSVTVDIEYGSSGKPSFPGVLWPDNAEPAWSSQAGKLDTVVLTWAERWLLRTSAFGYEL